MAASSRSAAAAAAAAAPAAPAATGSRLAFLGRRRLERGTGDSEEAARSVTSAFNECGGGGDGGRGITKIFADMAHQLCCTPERSQGGDGHGGWNGDQSSAVPSTSPLAPPCTSTSHQKTRSTAADVNTATAPLVKDCCGAYEPSAVRKKSRKRKHQTGRPRRSPRSSQAVRSLEHSYFTGGIGCPRPGGASKGES